MGLVARRYLAHVEGRGTVVHNFIRSDHPKTDFQEWLDRSQRTVFRGWKVDRILLQRKWKLGDLRFPVPSCRQQMAGITRRRQRAALAAGRKGTVLPLRRREDDGRTGEDLWNF